MLSILRMIIATQLGQTNKKKSIIGNFQYDIRDNKALIQLGILHFLHNLFLQFRQD